MADTWVKIAVATTDGLVVNSHFGKATHFQIVRMNIDELDYELIGEKNVEPVCHGGNHDDTMLSERINEFKEYDFILVSKVGDLVRNELERNGIEIYEIPGVIEDSLHKLFTHLQIQRLFL